MKGSFIMKLNNNGWGYRIFIMCLSMLSTLLIIANHYITIFINGYGK